jgi:FMN phosphatase YigB (HAD superfamily)
LKAIIFDFGGTIDTDGVHWSEKFWEYYQRFRVPAEKKLFEKAFVTSEQELGNDRSLRTATFYATLLKQFQLQFAILGLKIPQDETVKIVNACYADVGKTVAKAVGIIKGFHPRFTMSIVSNFYGNLGVVCEEFGLDRYCPVLIDSVLAGVRKPDPAIFQLALTGLGVRGEEAFVVGDSYDRDIVPAKKLGCRTIWLKGKSWMTPPSTDAADDTVQHFEEISSIITRSA